MVTLKQAADIQLSKIGLIAKIQAQKISNKYAAQAKLKREDLSRKFLEAQEIALNKMKANSEEQIKIAAEKAIGDLNLKARLDSEVTKIVKSADIILEKHEKELKGQVESYKALISTMKKNQEEQSSKSKTLIDEITEAIEKSKADRV